MNIKIVKKWIETNKPNGAVKLAGQIGVSPSVIWKMVDPASKYDPKLGVAKKIAAIIGVSLDQLADPKAK